MLYASKLLILFLLFKADQQVKKIGVHRHPNPEKLLNKLKSETPKNEDEARKVFEYLASQQENFTDSDWETTFNLY